jgi:hypothetical protein
MHSKISSLQAHKVTLINVFMTWQIAKFIKNHFLS